MSKIVVNVDTQIQEVHKFNNKKTRTKWNKYVKYRFIHQIYNEISNI